MFDMPSLGDAVSLRNRIVELEQRVKKLESRQHVKNDAICRLRTANKKLKAVVKSKEAIIDMYRSK